MSVAAKEKWYFGLSICMGITRLFPDICMHLVHVPQYFAYVLHTTSWLHGTDRQTRKLSDLVKCI